MRFDLIKVKGLATIFFLICASTNISAQTRDTTRFLFGTSVVLHYQPETDITISPTFQYYPSSFAFYIGPTIQTSLIKSQHINRYGYKLGSNYFFPQRKMRFINMYLQMEFNNIYSWKKYVSYDHAFPDIDIPATMLYKNIYFNIAFSLGLRFRITKRFFIRLCLGPALIINKDYGYYHKYQKTNSVFELRPGFTNEFEIGFKFNK